MNMISNELKYRHSDRAPMVQVRSYREDGRLIVSAQDNGIVLSAAQQAQLFGLFNRLHPNLKGAGIGLYLVKKISTRPGATFR
ncbi:ATP-binding protein [Hymenobacter tibetensis]|uniref:ATP-binding protein n=1 Tax=Hymenobacter tibetensis TaxID=497967 RepID=UPI00374C8CC7